MHAFSTTAPKDSNGCLWFLDDYQAPYASTWKAFVSAAFLINSSRYWPNESLPSRVALAINSSTSACWPLSSTTTKKGKQFTLLFTSSTSAISFILLYYLPISINSPSRPMLRCFTWSVAAFPRGLRRQARLACCSCCNTTSDFFFHPLHSSIAISLSTHFLLLAYENIELHFSTCTCCDSFFHVIIHIFLSALSPTSPWVTTTWLPKPWR